MTHITLIRLSNQISLSLHWSIFNKSSLEVLQYITSYSAKLFIDPLLDGGTREREHTKLYTTFQHHLKNYTYHHKPIDTNKTNDAPTILTLITVMTKSRTTDGVGYYYVHHQNFTITFKVGNGRNLPNHFSCLGDYRTHHGCNLELWPCY